MLKYLQKSSVAVHTAVAHDCLTRPGSAALKHSRLDDEVLNSALFLFLYFSLSVSSRCGSRPDISQGSLSADAG